jgi:CHAD domain-containing protein
MAYRLRTEESVARGLRRLSRNELLSARDELRRTSPPHEEAIHEARKSVKKVRAIVELIEADEGRGLSKCQKRLRKVNSTLSQVRDADAMLEILTKLRNKNPHLFNEHTFARMRRRLSSHKQAAMKAAQDGGAWRKVDRQLRTLRQDSRRWRPTHRRFGALAAGIRVTYGRGRKAMARARKRQRAADFHEWRKQVKALWYQLRLIGGCSPAIRKDAAVLHRVETWLGDDHNVVVLCAELSKDASFCDLEGLRRAADRYQCDLRRKAIASTTPMYGRTPGKYLRRVERAWNAWQRRKTAEHTRTSRRAA